MSKDTTSKMGKNYEELVAELQAECEQFCDLAERKFIEMGGKCWITYIDPRSSPAYIFVVMFPDFKGSLDDIHQAEREISFLLPMHKGTIFYSFSSDMPKGMTSRSFFKAIQGKQ